MIRTRTKLIENKEKPTTFLYTAEKQNENKKKTTKLKNKTGEIKTEDKEILKTAKEFDLICTKKHKQAKRNNKTF